MFLPDFAVKGWSKSRFNVFLSPFVAYKAVKFASVYTMFRVNR